MYCYCFLLYKGVLTLEGGGVTALLYHLKGGVSIILYFQSEVPFPFYSFRFVEERVCIAILLYTIKGMPTVKGNGCVTLRLYSLKGGVHILLYIIMSFVFKGGFLLYYIPFY